MREISTFRLTYHVILENVFACSSASKVIRTLGMYVRLPHLARVNRSQLP